jgi:hypothetical protein
MLNEAKDIKIHGSCKQCKYCSFLSISSIDKIKGNWFCNLFNTKLTNCTGKVANEFNVNNLTTPQKSCHCKLFIKNNLLKN